MTRSAFIAGAELLPPQWLFGLSADLSWEGRAVGKMTFSPVNSK